MTRFKNYINESRSKPKTLEQVANILHNGEFSQAWNAFLKQLKASQEIGTIKWLFRGIKRSDDVIITTPTGNRKSAYAKTNFYTLIFNNDPSWSKFPKREIICTYDKTYTEAYGDTYIVLPENNTSMGVCSSYDIFLSFTNTIKKNFPKNTPLDINSFMMDLYMFLNQYFFKSDSSSPLKTYQQLKVSCDNLWKWSKNNDINTLDYVENNIFFQNWDKIVASNMTLWEYIIDTLDPNKNNFKLQKISNNFVPNNTDSEVWIDTPCLLIRLFKILDLLPLVLD